MNHRGDRKINLNSKNQFKWKYKTANMNMARFVAQQWFIVKKWHIKNYNQCFVSELCKNIWNAEEYYVLVSWALVRALLSSEFCF